MSIITREELNESPIFEVIDGDRHYKIWANGKVEGFNPDGVLIVNRAAALIAQMKARHLVEVAHLGSPQTEIEIQGSVSHMGYPNNS